MVNSENVRPLHKKAAAGVTCFLIAAAFLVASATASAQYFPPYFPPSSPPSIPPSSPYYTPTYAPGYGPGGSSGSGGTGRPAAPSATIPRTIRSGSVTVEFTAEPGVTYRIKARVVSRPTKKSAAASKVKKTYTGKCRSQSGLVSCKVRIGKGTWLVEITPFRNGVAGTVLKKKVRRR